LRVDALRLKGAALCAAACVLAALGQGCAVGPAQQPAALLARTASPTPAQNLDIVESPLPQPKGFVGDFAEVIDAKTEGVLEAKLKLLKKRANIELAVATVETTGDKDIFNYSLAVARGWGVGPPAGEEGGGLLLLIAVKDHQWRIQVSRGLEADLPDDVVADIGRTMTPSLREGRYGPGVTKCVDGLIRRLAERRGFSMKDETIILEGVPKAKPKA
jgi:uncharacterized membrane protein YgcG